MTRHMINETLFDVAAWRLRGETEKQAFVPQGATDPAMGGGAPPMDPMAGGAPPMDPMAAGMPPGMPPGAPPMDPMAAAGAPPAAPPAAAPAAGAPAGGGKAKIDPAFIYMELSRTRKLVTHLMKHIGVEMPPDILDDGSVAMVAQGQMPESMPLGQGGEAEMGGPPAGGGGLPGIGQSGAINPIDPAVGGGTEKPASDVMSMFRGPAEADELADFVGLGSRIDALSSLSRSLVGD